MSVHHFLQPYFEIVYGLKKIFFRVTIMLPLLFALLKNNQFYSQY